MNEENGFNVNYDSLVTHLSHLVLSETDEQIKTKTNDLEKAKNYLNKVKNKVNTYKENSNKLIDEYSNEKIKSRILTLVGTLKKEGAVRGNNKVQIVKMLNTLNNLKYEELLKVEKKLNILS